MGTTYWVCIDCYMTHHGVAEPCPCIDKGEEKCKYLKDHPDCEPLSLIPAGSVVTDGLMWHEHHEQCPNHRARTMFSIPEVWPNEECDCEHITFSRSSCDGCGSTLAGSRESLTVWSADDEEV